MTDAPGTRPPPDDPDHRPEGVTRNDEVPPGKGHGTDPAEGPREDTAS